MSSNNVHYTATLSFAGIKKIVFYQGGFLFILEAECVLCEIWN